MILAAVLKSERNQFGEHVSTVVAYLNKGKTFGVSFSVCKYLDLNNS
jgi:hypothetical protein